MSLERSWYCVQERISELGLQDDFCWELQKLIGSHKNLWLLANATARQRCEAAVVAIEGGGK